MRLRSVPSEDVTWRDVFVVCSVAAATPKTPLAIALSPPQVWDDSDNMLAALVDWANLTYWRESDPKSRGKAPEPLPRPAKVKR